MTRVTRPVLRYHGGKWRLAPWIIAHFPPHRVYVEPFAGAASVLMRKPRSYAEVLNDLDGEIVNVFRVLRDRGHAAELERLLRLTPFARAEYAESLGAHPEPIEQARRTVVRAFMGFGSDSTSGAHTGFRAAGWQNRVGPPADWAHYPPHIPSFTARLAAVVLESRPACEIIAQQDSAETLFYCDPPYPMQTRSERQRYAGKGYRHEMTDDDHRALAQQLRAARGMVVLSGYPCALYDAELYPDWEREERPALADGAKPRTEVLWLNPAASAALRRTRAQGELLERQA